MRCITSRSKEINGAPAAVWAVISDIRNAHNHISAIKHIEILEQPPEGSLIGLKWKETREWMGRDMDEVMWITDAGENSFYETRAESHGCIYQSRLELVPTSTGTTLTMAFYCQPQSMGAKIMWVLTGWMAKNSLSKAFDKDLEDVKKTVESQTER
ncbi:SRPBCC family protein [Alteromonas ponticola]|uniref:SRPBCC family protein n=1 Tax=Alteromonas aquimaris TaxID=2998417 RepID=A0ABT3P7I3_9ALTE|nr:SRPBCC family protein [Alteromonas aquimaris]MCW8108717.1 SRPBCC family protein [Alteromonas aquimaris]